MKVDNESKSHQAKCIELNKQIQTVNSNHKEKQKQNEKKYNDLDKKQGELQKTHQEHVRKSKELVADMKKDITGVLEKCQNHREKNIALEYEIKLSVKDGEDAKKVFDDKCKEMKTNHKNLEETYQKNISQHQINYKQVCNDMIVAKNETIKYQVSDCAYTYLQTIDSKHV